MAADKFAAQRANQRASKIGRQSEADSLVTLLTWTLRLIVIIFVITLTISHFGANIIGFAFILGVIVLALSLAGRDVLTDIISRAMILIDRPFRIGDRLELPSIDSWEGMWSRLACVLPKFSRWKIVWWF